jgi:hypothetical protein
MLYQENKMNDKLKEIALHAGGSHYPVVGGETLEKFARLLIAECIDAVKNTPTTAAFTTFDKAVVDNTIANSVKAIEQRFL